MIAATYFDGRSAVAHQVTLVALHGHLSLSGDFLQRQDALHTLKLSESFRYAPTILYFADGARCEIHAAQDKAALLALLDYHPSFVQRMQQRWQAALAAVGLIALLLLTFRFVGLPWLTNQIVQRLPVEIEEKMGEGISKQMESDWFKPSATTEQQAELVQQAFARVVPQHPFHKPPRLLIRQMTKMGPNALAFPGGTVVINDGMIQLLCGSSMTCDASGQNRLSAVFSHELGHIMHRHSLQEVVGGSLVGVVSFTLFGDVSTLISAAPVLLTRMSFSREIEADADEYGIALMQKKGIPLQSMARNFELFMTLEKQNKGKEQKSSWFDYAEDYLSTHPSDAARLARVKQAMKEGR